MRRILGIIFVAVLTTSTVAPSLFADCLVINNISGVVLDDRDSLPIIGARVCLLSHCYPCGWPDSYLCALAGPDGSFAIADCCTTRFAPGEPYGGSISYQVVAPGYDSLDRVFYWDNIGGCPGEDDIVVSEGMPNLVLYLHPQAVSVDDDAELPAPVPDFDLALYPNPFNATTKIAFELTASAEVDLAIIAVSGRVVRHVAQCRLPAGPQEFTWDGRDDSDRSVASGIYFCRLKANGQSDSRKLVLLK